MGTLTGNTASLPEHCPHKLPTSCRLTATPSCCACQDKRPHAAAYPMYVDGIGMTMRSTRWTRYCYFCREFWENRVRATDPPMPASETRVPEVPDQAEFLKKWFEFHRGYRIERVLSTGQPRNTDNSREGQSNGDSTQGIEEERRIAVTLEVPWRDTAPGRLPLQDDNQDNLVPTTWQRPRVEGEGDAPQVSLEETLDDMLEAAVEEQSNRASFLRNTSTVSIDNTTSPQNNAQAQVQGQNQQQQQSANTRRTRPMQSDLPTTAHATSVELTVLREQITSLTNQRQTLTGQRDEMNRSIGTIEASLSELRQRADALARNARTMANMNRVFGSREEIEQQGADYVSPLTSMFSRAYERFRVAEEVRAEERASMRNLERNRVLLQSTWSQRRFPFEAARQARNETSARQQQSQTPAQDTNQADNSTDRQRSGQEILRNMHSQFRRLSYLARTAGADTRSLPESLPSLDDANVERPPPKSDDEMTIKLICKICLQQTSDTAVLPCGHLVMCSFCADAWVPSRKGAGVDETMAIGRVNCPLCRKQVKRKVRIYTA